MCKVVLMDTPYTGTVGPETPADLCGFQTMTTTFLHAIANIRVPFQYFIASTGINGRFVQEYLKREKLDDAFTVVTHLDFLQSYAQAPNVVLQSLSTRIGRACYFRMLSQNRNWSVVGISHDLFDRSVYDYLLLDCAQTFPQHDYLVCASQSARDVLFKQIDHIETLLKRRYYFRLPIVPHGLPGNVVEVCKRVARATLDIRDDAVVFLYFGRLDIWQKADLCGLV